MSPEDTVNAYFDAINLRDYQRAWDLGGKNGVIAEFNVRQIS